MVIAQAERVLPRYRLRTHKVTRPSKAPMVVIDGAPGKCSCGSASEMKYSGITLRVQPPKWQYDCVDCGKSVLTYTAPQEFVVEEALRIKRAKEAEALQRALQKQKLFGMEAN